MAEILLFLLYHYDGESPINIGNTQEISIKNTAKMIADIMRFEGEIIWDISKPIGQLRKPSDNSRFLELGWDWNNYSDFEMALQSTCEWFVANYPHVRGVK